MFITHNETRFAVSKQYRSYEYTLHYLYRLGLFYQSTIICTYNLNDCPFKYFCIKEIFEHVVAVVLEKKVLIFFGMYFLMSTDIFIFIL